MIAPTTLPTAPRKAPASEPIFKPDLVRRMLLEIFGGQWKAGDRLREENLAGLFRVSRTPVREALQEIAAIGLVELRPNCGAVVAPFGPREIEEIYQVRALLESEAARLACHALPIEDLRKSQDELNDLLAAKTRTPGWSQRAWDSDRRLHHLIATGCPNRRLAQEIARYGALVQIIRETIGNRDRAQDLALQEHREIVAALLRRSPAKAAAAMQEHVRSAGQLAVEAIQPLFSLETTNPRSRAHGNGRAVGKPGPSERSAPTPAYGSELSSTHFK